MFTLIVSLNAEALDNPTYFAGTPFTGPTTGLQGQDDDALAADYLEPVTTLPALSTKNEKIEAASSNCRAKGDDLVNDLELSSQKSDLIPELGSAYGANEEKSQDHAYPTLCEATIKEWSLNQLLGLFLHCTTFEKDYLLPYYITIWISSQVKVDLSLGSGWSVRKH